MVLSAKLFQVATKTGAAKNEIPNKRSVLCSQVCSFASKVVCRNGYRAGRDNVTAVESWQVVGVVAIDR
jgi:hypothetical protein